MMDDLFGGSLPDQAKPATSKEVVVQKEPGLDLRLKAHGSVMSMDEFATWMQANFSGGIQEALEQAAFMLCCDVISQDIAKATLRLRERLPNGTSRIVMPGEHEIASLLAMEPNSRHTWIEYVEMVTYWMCLTSNSYAVIIRDRKGDPLEIVPVQTGRVVPLVEGRDIFYEVTASTEQERALLGASFMRVPERDMIHVRGRLLDGMEGYSTLVAGKKTLAAGKALEELRESIFSEDGQQRGVFWRDGAMPDETMPDLAFQRLRQQLRELMNRYKRAAEPIVLEGGLKFQSISSNPKDIELAQQFTAQINATCRLLRVPPHKVFNLDNTKYDNLETQEKAYVSDTLIPVCERFEQRYAKALLSKKDRLRYIFQHDREEMMLKDTKAETDRAVRSLERGAWTFDEYRAVTGKNPLENGAGKHRLVPVNMTIIDENEEVVVGGASTPDQKPDDGEEPDAESAETPTNPKNIDGGGARLRLVEA